MRRVQKLIAAVLIAGIALTGCASAARRPRPAAPGPAAPGPAGAQLGELAPGGAVPADPATPDLAGGPEATTRESNPPPRPHEPGRNVYLHGDPSVREIALTFDDGPDNVFTPRVLDVLRREGVPATFFLVGNRVEANPAVASRIVAEGHDFGNHTWDHAQLRRLSPDQILGELRRTDDILTRTVGRHTDLFRPPYGEGDDKIVQAANTLGLRTILWNVDSLDWRSIPGWEVAYNELPAVRPGSIMLHHSAGGVGENLTGTVQEISLAIRTFKGQGYRFVTVSELLRPRP